MMTTNEIQITAPAPAFRSQFWQWWTAELKAMIPARLVGWVVGEVAITDLVAKGGVFALAESGSNTQQNATVVNADSQTRFLAELRANGHDQVRLLLNADQTLIKIVTLPAAIEENLRQTMSFELDRYTPFTSTQAYFDARVVKRDTQREQIDVALVATPVNTVAPLLATLRDAGLAVVEIGVADRKLIGGEAIDLLPADQKPPRKLGKLLQLNLALFGLLCLAALVTLLLPVWQKREQVVKVLIPLVGKTSADYEVSRRFFDEYNQLANDYNYVEARKHASYPAIDIVEELAKISPDTTWVQSLDLKSTGKLRELVIMGEAQSATRVIETLEQSPMFRNATQRSPTQRGSQPNTERYHVATELKSRPVPTAVIEEKRPEVVPVPTPVQPIVPLPAVAPTTTPPTTSSAPANTPWPVPAKTDSSSPATQAVSPITQAPVGVKTDTPSPPASGRKQP